VAVPTPNDPPLTETGHRLGGYHEYAPPPDLADALEALWTYETVGIRLAVHRVVPDAAVSLCFMGTHAPDGFAGVSRLRLIGRLSSHRFGQQSLFVSGEELTSADRGRFLRFPKQDNTFS
jgi:hypothetical protein